MTGLTPIVAVSLAPDASWAVTVEPGWVRMWVNGKVVSSFGSTRIRIRADTPAAAALYYQALRVIWVADGLLRQLERTPDTWPRHPPRPIPAPVRALGLSPSGSVAVLACDDGTLRSFDTDTGEFVWTLATGESLARAVAVASDRGPFVAVFADGSIRRYDLEARTSDIVGVGPPAQALAITSDGEVVVTAGADGLLQRWDRRTDAIPESRMLDMVITAVAVDRTGDQVLVGADNGRLSLHNLTSRPGVEYILPAGTRSVGVAAPQLSPERPTAPPVPAPLVDDDVRFTVYRPQVLPPGRWASLLMFAHKTDPVVEPGGAPVDPTKLVEARARAHFGGGMGRPVGADARQGLTRGARLQIVPELSGILCNPPDAEIEWWEPVHEVRFRLLAGPELAGTVVRGMVRVWCGPLIIGEVSIAMPVAASDPAADSPPTADSVLRYRKIFPSYSHRDRAIVQNFAEVARALGDQYLQDVLTLRAGERWDSRLLQLIEEADVFQLFWSRNSMRSPHCRDEWEHALALQRPLFIRPLYWEEPRPEDPEQKLPPVALQALHFVKVLATEPYSVVPPQAPARDPAAATSLPETSNAPTIQHRPLPGPATQPLAGRPTRRLAPLVFALLISLLIVVVGLVVALQIIGR
jgi:TIR domain